MFLLFLSQFCFGGDVAALGDREWSIREAAQRRLNEFGWLAVPALWSGMNDACPERAERSRRLWVARNRWPDAIAKAVLDDPSVPIADAWLKGDFGKVLCAEIDRRGGWETADSWNWVARKPFRTGSQIGDFNLVIETARGRAYASR